MKTYYILAMAQSFSTTLSSDVAKQVNERQRQNATEANWQLSPEAISILLSRADKRTLELVRMQEGIPNPPPLPPLRKQKRRKNKKQSQGQRKRIWATPLRGEVKTLNELFALPEKERQRVRPSTIKTWARESREAAAKQQRNLRELFGDHRNTDLEWYWEEQRNPNIRELRFPLREPVFKDLRRFFVRTRFVIEKELEGQLRAFPMMNVFISSEVFLSRFVEGEKVQVDAYLKVKQPILFTHGDSVMKKLNELFGRLEEELAVYTNEGSGFRVEDIGRVYIKCIRFEPLRGGAGEFKLPRNLSTRKAVISVQTSMEDGDCFKWAVRSCLAPAEDHAHRKSKYSENDGVNWSGIKFPTPWTQAKLLEKNNQHLSVNVFLYNNKEDTVSTLHFSQKEQKDGVRVVDLLLVVNELGQWHYVWVKSLPRLLRRQAAAATHQAFPCRMCLKTFCRQSQLDEHMRFCRANGRLPIKLEMPPEDKNILKFRNHQRTTRLPWVVYMDFECLLEPIQKSRGKNTILVSEHKICGASFLAVGPNGETLPQFTSRGPDAARLALMELNKVGKEIAERTNIPRKKLTPKERHKHYFTRTCCECGESLVRNDELDQIRYFDRDGVYRGRVHRYTAAPEERTSCYWKCIDEEDKEKERKQPKRDPEAERETDERYDGNCSYCREPLRVGYFVESHVDYNWDGTYRGAVHSKCRQHCRKKPKIPVFIHNAKGYDNHLLLHAIGELEGAEKLECIPNNREKLLTITYGNFAIVDSCQHMASSLDALVSSVALSGSEKFKITMGEFSEERLPLLLRKGVYSYERMQKWEDFELGRLPPQDEFYSSFNRCGISNDDYAHAQRVWEAFGCRTMGDYHDHYLKTDVTLLADVFQEHRRVCMEAYGLDPAHYLTAPSLAWDALLKYTGKELELLTDVDMYLFIERGLRGGISRVSRRLTMPNTPGLPYYDPDKPESRVLYVDANNLYGWAMCKMLPVGGFRWEVPLPTEEDILGWKDDSLVGRILEVDLEYPEELQDLHRDYPLAPEIGTVGLEEYSPAQRAHTGEGCEKVPRLLLTFKKKEHYVLHQENLRLYLRLGMRLAKVHRCLVFRQEAWMAPYIKLNTDMRAKAKTTFETDFYKLMNNSVFGKTMENLRKRTKVHILRQRQRDKVSSMTMDPRCVGHTDVGSTLTLVEHRPEKVYLNRPTYTGMCILDLSKTLMYRYFYDHLKVEYGEKCRLAYTDTDSFILEIETPNLYEDMEKHLEEWYDTSNYPKEHPLYSADRKKKVGYMKDEMGGSAIGTVACCSAKVYSFQNLKGEDTVKKAKGVKKVVIKKDLTTEMYAKVIMEGAPVTLKMPKFVSIDHRIFTEETNKVALSWLDPKSYVTANNEVYPFGHRLARNQ